MNAKIRKQIEQRKARIARRLDKKDNRGCQRMLAASLQARGEAYNLFLRLSRSRDDRGLAPAAEEAAEESRPEEDRDRPR